jgi:dipeptidyl aminopeptidase/acylaminoacyl peptidase
MTMRKRSYASLLFAQLFISSLQLSSQIKPTDFPQMPGAILLTGYPGYCLALTTSGETQVIQQGLSDTDIFAAMSRDESVIVSVYEKINGTQRQTPHLIFSVYSTREKKWKDFEGRAYRVHAALSPDGASLAYAATERDPRGSTRTHLHFIDIKTGVESVGPEIGVGDVPHFGNVPHLTWSPDSNRIAYSIEGSTIEVMDLKTERIEKVADGKSPVWSPSGEWIAYYDSKEVSNQIWIVHPDGTGAQLLATLPPDKWPHLGGSGQFAEPPVWSPDSKRILLNESWDADKGTIAAQIVEVSTRKMTRAFKDRPPVWGWAEAK